VHECGVLEDERRLVVSGGEGGVGPQHQRGGERGRLNEHGSVRRLGHAVLKRSTTQRVDVSVLQGVTPRDTGRLFILDFEYCRIAK
jgi:hypothetical protein